MRTSTSRPLESVIDAPPFSPSSSTVHPQNRKVEPVKQTKSDRRAAVLIGAFALLGVASSAHASNLVPQTPLPGKSIPKFVTALPTFGPAAPPATLPRVTATDLVVRSMQISQQALPPGFGPTKVWAYQLEDPLGNVRAGALARGIGRSASRGAHAHPLPEQPPRH